MKLLTITARTEAITGEVIVSVNALELDPEKLDPTTRRIQLGESFQVVVAAGEDVTERLQSLWPDHTICQTLEERAVYTSQFVSDHGYPVGG